MFTVLAFAFLTSFGSSDFSVDPNATTLGYSQSSGSLTLTGSDSVGETMGGYFSSGHNWSAVGNFGLRLSLSTANPSSLFYVEFYGGNAYTLAGIFSGDTTEITGPAGTEKNVILQYLGGGSGDFSDITAVQFTWSGTGSSVTLNMHEVVDVGDIVPVITYANKVNGNFRLDWEGTGPYPVSVQRRSSLTSGTWQTIASNITVRTYTDTSTPAGQAFYRLTMP